LRGKSDGPRHTTTALRRHPAVTFGVRCCGRHPLVPCPAPYGQRDHGHGTVRNGFTCWSVRGWFTKTVPKFPVEVRTTIWGCLPRLPADVRKGMRFLRDHRGITSRRPGGHGRRPRPLPVRGCGTPPAPSPRLVRENAKGIGLRMRLRFADKSAGASLGCAMRRRTAGAVSGLHWTSRGQVWDALCAHHLSTLGRVIPYVPGTGLCSVSLCDADRRGCRHAPDLSTAQR
jgi:hypothetical protein